MVLARGLGKGDLMVRAAGPVTVPDPGPVTTKRSANGPWPTCRTMLPARSSAPMRCSLAQYQARAKAKIDR